MFKTTNHFFKLFALTIFMCGSRLAFAHAGHGEPHGTDAHASDFMSYVIGFMAATALLQLGGMGIAKYIKGNLSQARTLALSALCTACVLVFLYWFAQV